MQINHQKVSGVANPTDPTKVGGEDWDDAHAITGPRLFLSIAMLRQGTLQSSYAVPGITIEPAALGIDGIYDLTFDPALYNITSLNSAVRCLVLDIPVSGGFFGGAQVILDNKIRVKTYTGNWDVTYLTSNGVIWIDIFKLGA